MTLATITARIADNLGILRDDGTYATGSINETKINNMVNNFYQEEIFPLISDKFPSDFTIPTYPYPTYTATATVAVGSTASTLVAASAIFNNSMLGMTVQNTTDGETAIITGYTNTTTVTLDTVIGDTWDGDTIYVLGNTFTLGGDSANMKEIVEVYIKYQSTDADWTKCQLKREEELRVRGDEVFTTNYPIAYVTANKVGGIVRRAIGFVPYPTDYSGSFFIKGIERPAALTAGDEPALNIVGASQVIINGVTAWGFRKQRKFEDADRYEAMYNTGKANLIRNYKPLSRNRVSETYESEYDTNLVMRNI